MRNLIERLTGNEREIVRQYISEAPVRLGALAKSLGVEVLLSTLSPGVSGEIRRVGNDTEGYRYQIKINRHEKKERQRFTLAHEISHFLLHRDRIGDSLSDDVLYRSKLSNTLEYEANRLAAEIVMPSQRIDSMLENIDTIDDSVVNDFAHLFGVSSDAMSIRLGLV